MAIDQKIVKKLFKHPNVNGVGFGEMLKNGKPRGMGYVVTVTRKVPKEELKKKDLIPRVIDDNETDVIEVGEIKALGRTDDELPFMMGDSVGHRDITAGTAGFLARKLNDLTIYFVSNNHVLANINKGKKGDPVYKPGPYDGGNNLIGYLESFVPIKFPGCTLSAKIVQVLNTLSAFLKSSVVFQYQKTATAENANKVDCALAKLINEKDALKNVRDLGIITGIGTFAVGDEVWKSGRTTGVTKGAIALVYYTGQVNMGQENGAAVFEDQYLINTPGFSAGGDSGSSVHKKNESNELVLGGLLFAGSDKVTLVNKVQHVLNGLGVVAVL